MTKIIKDHQRIKYRLFQATIWGEFFLTIILVVFLFPGSQFLYANTGGPPPRRIADTAQNNLAEKPDVSIPGNLSDTERDTNKTPEVSHIPDTPIEHEMPEISEMPNTSENPGESTDIKESDIFKPVDNSAPAGEQNQPDLEQKDKIVFRGNPQAGKKVAITIDDGPYAVWTEEYLKVLEEYQVPALFFLVGSRVERYPEIAWKIVERGFDIGSHSYRHAKLTVLKPKLLEEDFAKTSTVLSTVGTVKFFRPPYGDYNQLVIDISEKHSLRTIGWNVDPRDWDTEDADKVTQRVLSSVKDGAIILLHEGRESTLAALPKIITGLKEKGYQIVSVSDLL